MKRVPPGNDPFIRLCDVLSEVLAEHGFTENPAVGDIFEQMKEAFFIGSVELGGVSVTRTNLEDMSKPGWIIKIELRPREGEIELKSEPKLRLVRGEWWTE